MDKKDFQTIHEIGVSNLIKKLQKYGGAGRPQIQSCIDDASVVQMDENGDGLLLASSAISLEGVHFDLTYTPLRHLGYKLLTTAVSKIYAMNGTPILVQVDIAVPNKLSVSMIEQIFNGLDVAGKTYNCTVRSSDTTASHQVLSAALHVTGTVSDSDIVYRKGCEPGDQICVSGDLGAAMAGLRVLLREKQAWKEKETDHFEPDLTKYEYVVQRQLMPTARYDFVKKFNDTGLKPTSLINLNQGLLNNLQQLADAGSCGSEIFTPAVPISLETRAVADEMQEDVDRYAFYGGEDYELLFTLKTEDVERLKAEINDFTVIGEIKTRKHGIVLNTGEGNTMNISDQI